MDEALKEFLIAKGLCTKCLRRKPEKGKRQCDHCAQYNKKYYAQKLKAGSCITCGKKNEDIDWSIYCEECRKKQGDRQRKLYQKRRVLRRCTDCARPLTPDEGADCADCREKDREKKLLNAVKRAMEDDKH